MELNDKGGINVEVPVPPTPVLVNLVKILQLGATNSIRHGESCVPNEMGCHSYRMLFWLLGAIVTVGAAPQQVSLCIDRRRNP